MDSDHKAQAERAWDTMSESDRENWFSKDVFRHAYVIEAEDRMHGVRKAPPATAAAPVPFAETEPEPAPAATNKPATPAAAAAFTAGTSTKAEPLPSLARAKALAKAEWDADAGGCQNDFESEAIFVGYRSAQLRGRTPR